ncbi:uncharacterized protein LOC130725772 [Lotus japonicus]|uniref:uncharacterized protein LOC130725772 n=1 Tax=Lotus japonicus TaxID=34305 RepID=UPI00259007BA|nr:uncharacterized protein LOC130725772 [Lotus japonicus]
MCKHRHKLKFATYCSTTWLVHKQKFAKAWTNHVMHFGTTTSNRAEGAHASLKLMLRNSKGDLATSWDASHSLTTNRHTEIVASFERSMNKIDHLFKTPFYTNIRGFVSIKCLKLIDAELTRMRACGGRCDCLLRETHGLPCGCQLAAFLHPYIDTVTDVEDDGNCGYRSIAALLGHSAGQDGWPWVRASLIQELELRLHELRLHGVCLHELCLHELCLPQLRLLE